MRLRVAAGLALVGGLVIVAAAVGTRRSGEDPTVPGTLPAQASKAPGVDAGDPLGGLPVGLPEDSTGERRLVVATEPPDASSSPVASSSTLSGLVRDTEGAAVAKTEILFVPFEGRIAKTTSDAEGRFELELKPSDVRGDLLARTWSSGTGVVRDVGGGEEVEVRLGDRALVLLSVEDDAGASIERYRGESHISVAGRWIEDSRTNNLRRLRRYPVPVRIDIESYGYEPASFGPFSSEEIARLERLETGLLFSEGPGPHPSPGALHLRLKRLAHIEGIALRGQTPVPNARVELLPVDPSAPNSAQSSEPWIHLSHVGRSPEDGEEGLRVLHTRGDGTFSALVGEPGTYEVRVWSSVHGGGRAGPFSVAKYQGAEQVEVQLEVEPAQLVGKVLLPEGANTEQLRLYVPSRGASARVLEDGSFRMEGIPPGLVLVRPRFSSLSDEGWRGLLESEQRGAGDSYTWKPMEGQEYPWGSLPPWLSVDRGYAVDLVPGETREVVFDLRGEPEFVVRGWIELGMHHSSLWTDGSNGAFLYRSQAADFDSCSDLEEGRFLLGANDSGAFQLRVGYSVPGEVRVAVEASLDLTSREMSWELRPPLGGLRVERQQPVRVVWEDAQVRVVLQATERGQDGAWLLPNVPAGEVLLVDENGTELGRTLVVAGETTTYAPL